MGAQQHSNYVNGQWVAGTAWSKNINPSDLTDVVGEYAHADQAQTQEAIAAARAAAPAWGAFNVQARADALEKVGAEIVARKDELGKLLSREEGKTLAEGVGEVVRAGNIFKFFAGEVLRRTGELVPSVRPGVDVEVTREPLGVVGIITPWNFPAAIPAWKIAPALAYGNCVVFKPADLVPGSAWALADIISRAGLPAGAFNLVMGRGSVVGEALVNDARVDAISFTGSVDTGRKLAQKAAARLAKFQLEMGGKNPLVVLDDADLKTAVESAVNGAYFSTGQRCTASSRLIVTQGIHGKFVDALTERLKNLVVDDALKAGTQIGPVVDKNQLNQDLFYIEEGKKEGAKLTYGGRLLKREKEGFYLEPALFTETSNVMRINREEVFGPVAAVVAAKDYEEALQLANDTPFGLSAGIVTSSLKHAAHFRRNSQAGMVMVNLPTAGVDYHVPFGGRKGSSYGPREQGRYAVEFFTTVKTSYVAALA
jgi:aldehyde dehydrogenase (NAD+)